MAIRIRVEMGNDLKFSGYAVISFEMFGYSGDLTCAPWSDDVPLLLEALREFRGTLGDEVVASEYSYPRSEFAMFSRIKSLGSSMFDLDLTRYVEWWLCDMETPDDARYMISRKTFADMHAVRRPERAAEMDRDEVARGYTLTSPHIVFVWDDWTQDTIRTEIDRVIADIETQKTEAEDAVKTAVDNANAKVAADLAGVEWTTRKLGNWRYDDDEDPHEFLHTLTIDGKKFRIREGDMFDVGTYAKFDYGEKDTDSPEAERAYRLVRLYGERAKGSLYLRM